MPRKAQAIFGIADVNLTNIDRVIKDMLVTIWSAIVSSVKIKLKNWLISRIEAWGRGEITGEEIFQEMPWEDWLEEAADEAAGEFLNDFFGTNLCEWTSPQIKILFLAMATGEGAKPPECTLSQIRENIEDIFDPGRDDGWDAFIVALEPQNNDLGVYLLAQGGTLVAMGAAVQGKTTEAGVSQGYQAQEECEEWECVGIVPGTTYPGKCFEIDLRSGQFTSKCVRYKVSQPAADIAQTFKYIATVDLKQIVESEDLAEILAAFISALMNRLQKQVSNALKK